MSSTPSLRRRIAALERECGVSDRADVMRLRRAVRLGMSEAERLTAAAQLDRAAIAALAEPDSGCLAKLMLQRRGTRLLKERTQ